MKRRYVKVLCSPPAMFSNVMAPNLEFPLLMYLAKGRAISSCNTYLSEPGADVANLLDLNILIVSLTIGRDWRVELAKRAYGKLVNS